MNLLNWLKSANQIRNNNKENSVMSENVRESREKMSSVKATKNEAREKSVEPKKRKKEQKRIITINEKKLSRD